MVETTEEPVDYAGEDLNREAAPDLNANRYNDRLGLTPRRRVAITTATAFAGGAFLGVIQGGRVAELVFRAENSHRTPQTEAGWLLYHKSKNTQIFKASMKEAFKMGCRIAPCVGLFYVFEIAMDNRRFKGVGRMGENTHQDFMSSTFAGLGVAGTFSLWSELELESL